MPEIASMPESPARAAAAQTPPSAAPPPAVSRSPSIVDLEELPLQAQDVAGKPFVGHEDVRAHAEDRERQRVRRGRRERRREAGLGLHAAEEPRRAADPPGREPGQRQARFDRAVLRVEVQIHPARAATQPIAARTAAAARPPSTSSTTTPQPPGRLLRGADRTGLHDVEEAEEDERADPRGGLGPPGRIGPEERHGRAGQQLARDLVDHDASRVLGPERPADRTGDADADEPDERGRTSIVRPPARHCAWTWIAANRERSGQAMARPTSEPAVPGMTGERPEPKPVARNAASGFAANARRASDIDTGSCRSEDPSVLIASCSASSEVYNRAERAEFFSRSRKVRTCPA